MPSARGSKSTTAKKTALPDKAAPRDKRVIPFEDNRLLASILGSHDATLAMLDERLNVECIPHGNVISIEGNAEDCETASNILNELYSRAENGEEIGLGEVDGALRHAGVMPLGKKPQSNQKQGPRVEKEASSGKAQIKTRRKLITARTPAQGTYINAMQSKDLVFGIGPAGTGKTFLAVAYAAALLESQVTERIILSRPAVEAGERLGFLPGDMKEKVDPYLRPLYDALYEMLPREKVDKSIEGGVIEIAPLAFMRGRTLSNAVVILDEAQNCTAMQMKMFLTRLGEGSKMVVTGDPSQIDLPKGETSGLMNAVGLLRSISDIGIIEFTGQDVVRRDLVAKIVSAYDVAEAKQKNSRKPAAAVPVPRTKS